MTQIISVRFKSGGKEYYFSPNGLTFQPGDGVVVETSNGLELGECVKGNTMVDEMELLAPLRPVVRAATQEDYKTAERNKEKEAKAFAICQEKVAQHGLDMKLVEAQYSFEGNKVVVFFTSEGRVDFRALVKDLASAIHARIELRQIGVRDEARMLGGLGICGRPFCCSQFLEEFQPVSIKMAKTQNLSLNPTKISGTCGRLMCCLKYEQDAYEDLVKRAPRMDSFVETPDGVGTVSSVNLLREKVNVRLEDDPETPHCYHNCEVCVVRSGKGKRPEGYVAPSKSELEKLRKQPDPKEEAPRPQESRLAAALSQVLSHDESAQAAAPVSEQDEHHSRNRSHRRRSRGNGPRPEGGEKPIQQPKAEEKKPQPAPEQKAEGEKKPNRNRHRRHYHRKPGGGQGTAPAQG